MSTKQEAAEIADVVDRLNAAIPEKADVETMLAALVYMIAAQLAHRHEVYDEDPYAGMDRIRIALRSNLDQLLKAEPKVPGWKQ
jgi:hypothetical protein